MKNKLDTGTLMTSGGCFHMCVTYQPSHLTGRYYHQVNIQGYYIIMGDNIHFIILHVKTWNYMR